MSANERRFVTDHVPSQDCIGQSKPFARLEHNPERMLALVMMFLVILAAIGVGGFLLWVRIYYPAVASPLQ